MDGMPPPVLDLAERVPSQPITDDLCFAADPFSNVLDLPAGGYVHPF
jgi:hypothetical protein